jgi:hypothetical protein
VANGVQDRRPPNRPPQPMYDLVLCEYQGDKTRSAAIVILTHFCGIMDRHASFCFDGIPEIQNVLVSDRNKQRLVEIQTTLESYKFVTKITEELV